MIKEYLSDQVKNRSKLLNTILENLKRCFEHLKRRKSFEICSLMAEITLSKNMCQIK